MKPSAPGRPAWVARVQSHGLTPAILEEYLLAGWPPEAIAKERSLELKDVLNAMDRWGFSETSPDNSADSPDH